MKVTGQSWGNSNKALNPDATLRACLEQPDPYPIKDFEDYPEVDKRLLLDYMNTFLAV